jgi:tetratricopeptide (TPR) repeat protein
VDTLVEQGNHCILEGTEKSLGHALDFFNQAIARDPKFAPAYVGVFRTRLQQQAGLFRRSAIKEQNVQAAVAKLNEIAPKLAETRVANCYVKLLDGHLPDALAESRLALNAPTGSKEGRGWVHAFCGFFLVASGYPEEALREFQIAKQIFPTDPVIEHFLGHPYRVQRKFNLALEHYQRSIELDENFYLGHRAKARTLEETGEFEKAIDEHEISDLIGGEDEKKVKTFYNALRDAYRQGLLQGGAQEGARRYFEKKLEAAMSESPPDTTYAATLLAHLGRTNESYECLEKAVQQGDVRGFWFEVSWDLNDPRYRTLAAKAGFQP